MNLSDARFSQTVLCYGTPDNVILHTVYTCESQKALFDVIPVDGKLYYRVNMRRVDTPSPQHRAICEHFSLGS